MALKHRRSLGKASVPFDQMDGEVWFNGEFAAWERRQDPRINVAIGQWSSYFNPTEKLKGIRLDIAESAVRSEDGALRLQGCRSLQDLHHFQARYADTMMLDEQLHEGSLSGGDRRRIRPSRNRSGYCIP